MTRVSIVIPSYRQPQFLGRALESCLSQDHDDLEVIVVDDRSRDSSLALAVSMAKTDPRVTVIEAEANGGLGRARNLGVAHASGELLCFLDSDDYLLPGSITARLEAFPAARSEFGDALAGVYGDWQHVAETVDQVTPRRPRTTMSVVSRETYTGENVFICSAPLVRRDLVVAAGGFPEGLPMLEDFALWARILAGGGVFAPVSAMVSTYRQRPNSMLRGDGAVVMADHVEVINEWMSGNGIDLTHGGAIDAWLADTAPFSHGRMMWNLPSVMGVGGAIEGATPAAVEVTAGVTDFMATGVSHGLHESAPVLTLDDAVGEVAVITNSVWETVEAVPLLLELGRQGRTVSLHAPGPTRWIDHWPAALAGKAVLAVPPGGGVEVIDLGAAGRSVDRDAFADGVRLLWPDAGSSNTSQAVVFVPEAWLDHPALDAWLSVALRTLAELEMPASVMSEALPGPNGWRARHLAFDEIAGASVVVAPAGRHEEPLSALCSVVTFDPTEATGLAAARTAGQLREALSEFVR